MLDSQIECRLTVVTEPDGEMNLHYHYTVTDPTIAHLVEQLQTELRSPQPMSQLVIASIVTVLLTHLLHQPINLKD
jgi:hypothetical protein